MSGLMSANSAQSTPIRPARLRCSGRSVLLPDADGPLVFMTTGRCCGGTRRKPSRSAASVSIGSSAAAIRSAPTSLHAIPAATAAMSSRVPHGCPWRLKSEAVTRESARQAACSMSLPLVRPRSSQPARACGSQPDAASSPTTTGAGRAKRAASHERFALAAATGAGISVASSASMRAVIADFASS